ncbi:MAG: hypothetical protein IKP86_05275 [Anaerolineaceae bacterium]|nr:hypothetical protein [Anaerolineaceae bacterium]
MTEKLSQKDYELINSYLDQELDRKGVVQFAKRMAEEPEIEAEIAELMKVKSMIKELPTVTPPRNYILTRAMAEEARPKPWWERLFPVFRTAAAFCALALAFTFLFPLIRQQSDAGAGQSVPADSAAESVTMDSAEYEEEPVQKALVLSDLYDEEIILDEREYGVGEEAYHAVMPSYGVMGGNPRIEYMMRMEEQQNAENELRAAEILTVPEGYISVEEAASAQRSLALKIVLGGGLILSICALLVLRRRKKMLEVQ